MMTAFVHSVAVFRLVTAITTPTMMTPMTLPMSTMASGSISPLHLLARGLGLQAAQRPVSLVVPAIQRLDSPKPGSRCWLRMTGIRNEPGPVSR